MPPPRTPAAPEPNIGPLLARASQLLKAGRPGDAVGPLTEAARLQPGNSSLQHDLGVACLESGRPADALAAFRRSVEGNPRFAKAYWRMGTALEALGETVAAIAAYRRATELLPSLTEAAYRAGNLLETLGNRAEAIACFRRAASSGKTSLGRLGAARALLAENRDADAERVLRQTLALDPTNAVANDLLGTVLADAGRFDEAGNCHERAIAKEPLLAGSYYELARCRRLTADDDALVARMQVALADPRLDAAQRLRVHLALAKAADDVGDYALAMRHCDAADALRRGLVAFDPDAFAAQVTRLIARFTPDLIERALQLGQTDATPVLILGMPRSGTTLVEQIVSGHKEVRGGGELDFWTVRGAQYEQAGPAGTEAPFLCRAAADYLGVLRGIAPDAARVTDKMPLNFVWAGLIHLALPRATIIHCRRSPIDTALSIHQTHFNRHLRFPTGGPELVAYYRQYRRLTDHWRAVLPADRFVEIDYAALTAEPEPTIRRIVASCGLEWDDACLQPERNPRVVKTPSRWQARQPVYRTAVNKWRRYEPWLGPLGALVDGASDGEAAAFAPEPAAEPEPAAIPLDCKS
jgi:tetratricopeptide (TPR) repeat protein